MIAVSQTNPGTVNLHVRGQKIVLTEKEAAQTVAFLNHALKSAQDERRIAHWARNKLEALYTTCFKSDFNEKGEAMKPII